MSERPPAALGSIIGGIASARLLGVMEAPESGQVVGCGLAVLDAGLVGLFDLVVEPNERRRGYGTELVRYLIDWGLRYGADSAYLQVTKDNVSATSLYERIGFRRVYDYWYRVGPSPD
jgi:ribosomal protein S18 acetylase RimI-like enzyme